MIYEGFIDILFSGDQDIEFSNGDIMITRGVDAIKREIFKRLTTERGEWPLFPSEGASLNEYIGEPNTRETADLIKKHLLERLSPVVLPAALQVQVIPTDLESVAVIMKIKFGGDIVGSFSLKIDYINGIVYPGFDDKVDSLVTDKSTTINEPGKIRQYNKYWDQIRKQ